jgi:peptidoglycan/xylan/chitin deacetylase (PgdA/CDA1 family)
MAAGVVVATRDDSPEVAERPGPTSTSAGSTTAGPTTTTAPTTVPTTAPTTPPPTTSPTVPTTAPPPAAPAIVIRQGDTSRPVVAITIDAGSDTGHAAEILDTLAAYGVRATFGMTGRWAEANSSLVRRMAAEGHQLVNHSFDHPSFTGRSTGTAPLATAQRLDQLARADAAIRAAGGGTTAPWFRPPYGDVDDPVLADVGSAGYRYALMWTVDSLGWKGDSADQIVARCLDRATAGAIYLFHVGSASADHLALPRVIDGLRQRGYSFVTAAALVGG